MDSQLRAELSRISVEHHTALSGLHGSLSAHSSKFERFRVDLEDRLVRERSARESEFSSLRSLVVAIEHELRAACCSYTSGRRAAHSFEIDWEECRHGTPLRDLVLELSTRVQSVQGAAHEQLTQEREARVEQREALQAAVSALDEKFRAEVRQLVAWSSEEPEMLTL